MLTPHQLIVFVVLAPPIMAALLCLLFKARGAALDTSETRVVRNTSDRVAFLALSATFYLISIGIAVLAHYQHQ